MTEPTKPSPPGRIAVQVCSDSIFFGQAVPVEVRDSRLRLVAKATGQGTLELPAGLYEVSAVLEDGRRHSEVVQVTSGKRTTVELASDIETPSRLETTGSQERDAARCQRPRFTRSMADSVGTDVEADVDMAPDVELLEAHGASLVRMTQGLLSFRYQEAAGEVPSAALRIGGRRLRISLPISLQSGSPSGSCAVTVERTSTGIHAHAWIAPERTVANALQNMLSSGFLMEAADVADQAVQLLRDKYEDPTGAALGALILYKTGRLQPWTSWVENLASDFPWLPDGKVLLARMRREGGETADAVLALAMDASRQRMLYAESYSLLLDLLRRWPCETPVIGRQNAIEQLAGDAPYIDWESACLSQWLPS